MCEYHTKSWVKSSTIQEIFGNTDTEEEDVIYYSKVRWLSKGNVLLRFSS